MRSLFGLIWVLGALTAASCSKGKNGDDVDPTTGVTAEQYQILREINSSLHDLNLAMELGTSEKENATNEKVSKIAEIIKQSGCQLSPNSDKSAPPEVFDKEWTHTYSVSGAGCSLLVNRDWRYLMRNSTRIWSTHQKFEARSKELGEESPIQSFDLQSGELSVENVNGGTQLVKGSYTFSNFVVNGVGLITANLSTSQSYNGFKSGGGTVTFSMGAHNAFRAKVVITWRAKGQTKYKINGHNVDRAVVEDLFSAYGLLEIEARSKKMLY